MRKAPKGREEIKVDLQSILAGHSPDPILQADDILFVPGSGGKKALHTLTLCPRRPWVRQERLPLSSISKAFSPGFRGCGKTFPERHSEKAQAVLSIAKEDSRFAMKTLRARSFASFTLSGQSEILRGAQNDRERAQDARRKGSFRSRFSPALSATP